MFSHFRWAVLVFAVAIFVSSSASAQLITSIGGVEGWFRGDAGVTTDAFGVSQWNTQVGTDHALRMNATLGPMLVNSPTLNNQPVLRFSGGATNDDLAFTGVAHGNGNDFSLLAVVQPTAGPDVGDTIGFFLGSNAGGNDSTKLGFWNQGGGFFRRVANGANQVPGTWPAAASPIPGSAAYLQRNSSNIVDSVVDGVALADPGGVAITQTSQINRIGGPENSASSQNFPGDIAELVFFGDTLNTAERTLAMNYLSAKYNIGGTQVGADNTLGSDDRYAGDLTSNGNFDQGVFGIGQAADGSSLTSSLDGGMSLTATGGLDNDEFVMAGFKVATNAVVAGNLNPQLAGDQWQREFFVDISGGNVDVDLAFDFSDGGLAAPDPSDEFSLLFRTDEGSPFDQLDFTPLVSGDTVTFSLNTGDLPGDGIYTLGVNVAVVPEPHSIAIWCLLGLISTGIAWRRTRARVV